MKSSIKSDESYVFASSLALIEAFASGDINPTPEVLIPTRASLMLESIQHDGGKPALVPKADPSVAAALAYRRRDTTVWWCLFRLMICSLLVIAAVWALLLRPQALT